MSHTQKGYYASWVFKVDFKSAWYKELLEIARTRAQDPWFYHLEIRKVSPENRWIQFVYCIVADDVPSSQWWGAMRHTYKKQLQDTYGNGVYAWDYYESDEIDRDRIIVSKALTI